MERETLLLPEDYPSSVFHFRGKAEMVSPCPLLYALTLASLFCCSLIQITLSDVNLGNPIVLVTPSPLVGYSSTGNSAARISCKRVAVTGISRLKIGSYANSLRVTLKPSDAISERHHSKIEICFHRNASIGLCQCSNDEWKAVQRGQWSSIMSPYEHKYVDVKFIDGLSGSVAVSIEEEFQQWRLLFLGFGFVLLLLAPFVSNWLPFYYSSSMALGIILVILILLFQGMKLLPTGRKSAFYFAIYGSLAGIGTYALRYFSMLINSILVNFGLSEEMYNPVSVFVLLGITVAGAGLGYWIVRKYVISDDGGVDIGVAQFVKWATRFVAAVSILQSSLDGLLAMVALAACSGFCFLISAWKGRSKALERHKHLVKGNLWQQRAKKAAVNHNRAEFLSRPAKVGSGRTAWESPNSPYTWSGSPVKGLVMTSSSETKRSQDDYYSTFHKTPKRRKFTKKEWEDFTRESTRQAMAEWASTPEFTEWVMDHADRIQVLPNSSSDDDCASSADSSDETVVESGTGFRIFKYL